MYGDDWGMVTMALNHSIRPNPTAMAGGYRVSFLEPDRGRDARDAQPRAWTAATEKRWTVAGAKVPGWAS